jgi:hypothetical protein
MSDINVSITSPDLITATVGVEGDPIFVSVTPAEIIQVTISEDSSAVSSEAPATIRDWTGWL